MRKLTSRLDPTEICRVTLDEAAELLAASSQRSVAVFEHGTLQVKLYAPRGHDAQTPHARDEIYVVVRGRGWFVNEDRRHPFEPHDVLFARAGATHRFEEFSDDFLVWVLFYGPQGGEPDPGS
jgi:mannose-6-phosphate isomerase-like protein (cupin superfamily)